MFNNSKIEELEKRIYLLEYPYKFEVGKEVNYDCYGENFKCLIIDRYQNHNGYKNYKLFGYDTIIEDVSECEIKELTKQ